MKLNRVSLNVVGLNRIGLNRIGSPSRGSSSGSDRSYIDPEVLASLKAVVIVGNKTNNDSDRAIVKNLVDPDNPFVISNAAYTEGSGYADKDSPYYGAFVTDGIDDLITSTKTVQEMLGGSNEITVVSMAHFIKGESNAPEICRINQIRRDTRSIRNSISKIGKSGIFGYTYKNGVTTINNILGDKNDCTAEGNLDGIVAPFSVEGYYYNNNSNPLELCSIAWYWTIIANKVLITDQINQVIAYFNLDRTLKPDILCDVKKQGITNDNHAEFGDKLIDFSGNGRDIQMYNLAWKGGSGIAAKPYETIKDYKQYEDNLYQEVIIHNEFSYTTKSKLADRYWAIQSNRKDNESLVVTIITDKDCEWICNSQLFNSEGVQEGNLKKKQNVFANTPTEVTIAGRGYFEIPEGYTTYSAASYINLPYSNGEVTVTFIPSCKGGILLDGINDFGKVIDMPIYKDYTFISKYQRLSYREAIETEGGAVIASKSYSPNQGAFIFNGVRGDYVHDCYSFGLSSSNNLINDKNLEVYYQTKYTNQGKSISSGTAADSDILWLGTVRDNDTRFINAAIYFLMSFPYSMSKFLIERQLKKYKLGTLYPNMVEFRPIVKSNSEYQVVGCYIDTLPAVVGNYYPINSKLRIAVTTKGAADEVTSLTVNGVSLGTPSVKGNRFTFNGTLSDKSPQKINITIDEYIRYEDIVQPYPVLLRFNDENGNEVSWGGKFRVGSTITRIGSFYENNLIDGLYIVRNPKLNGNNLITPTHVVEKSMVFTCDTEYLLDNNEPKCILSPSRLRMPNSSYKILGYIPDISGHGNHGVIHNSAYAGMSGANGYLQNFSGWTKASGVSSTDSVISSSNNLVAANGWIAYVTSGTVIPTFKVEISGIPINGNLRFEGSDQTLVNGVNTIQGLTTTKVSGFYISNGYDNDWSNLRIEQIGEYEGAYCLDGVDDFVTIPTATGGKQVFMKVNSRKSDCYLYDQRNNWTQYLGIVSTKDFIAYNYSNQRGKTYIDGILNENITANDLISITHNITVTNNRDDVEQYFPCIGTSFAKNSFAQMSLYDFMLFDNISTDDKIKELNEYVGIEGNVWGILTQLSNSTLISNETLIKNE